MVLANPTVHVSRGITWILLRCFIRGLVCLLTARPLCIESDIRCDGHSWWGLQHVRMQRVRMQRVRMQRVRMQRVRMQRVRMQSVGMQRVPYAACTYTVCTYAACTYAACTVCSMYVCWCVYECLRLNVCLGEFSLTWSLGGRGSWGGGGSGGGRNCALGNLLAKLA